MTAAKARVLLPATAWEQVAQLIGVNVSLLSALQVALVMNADGTFTVDILYEVKPK